VLKTPNAQVEDPPECAVDAAAGAGAPDWSTLVVEGPTEIAGRHGRVWFTWTARVAAATRPKPGIGRRH
jgi:hypothetical protein